MKEIEFWFSIGSTYTYLSVTRIAEVSQKTGVSLSWQPFSVRKIMREMDNIPFPPTKKVKVDYMWRDIERRAHSYGFKANVPAPYPLKEFDLAKGYEIAAEDIRVATNALGKITGKIDVESLLDKIFNDFCIGK